MTVMTARWDAVAAIEIDSTLQSLTSVNEMMAEAPVILTPQSEEEQASL